MKTETEIRIYMARLLEAYVSSKERTDCAILKGNDLAMAREMSNLHFYTAQWYALAWVLDEEGFGALRQACEKYEKLGEKET